MPKPTEGKERERKPPSVYNKGEMSEKNISLPKKGLQSVKEPTRTEYQAKEQGNNEILILKSVQN